MDFNPAAASLGAAERPTESFIWALGWAPPQTPGPGRATPWGEGGTVVGRGSNRVGRQGELKISREPGG